MGVKLAAASGGSIELVPTNTASNFTVTVPAVTATALTDSAGILNIGSGQIYKDASGNLGLGVTPSAWGSAYSKAIQISTQGAYVAGNTTGYSGGTYAWFGNNGYLDSAAAFRYTISTSACQYQQVANSHQWLYAPNGTAGGLISFSEAMRIDSSGNLLVGTTTNVNGARLKLVWVTGGYGIESVASANTISYHANFGNASNPSAGNISTTNNATNYATASDYRLKEDILPMVNALGVVAQLKPVTYKWKNDGSDGQGFIAHELQEVVEGCVTGTKDATREQAYEVTPAVKDEEGNVITGAVMGTRTVPLYQGVDTSFLVATLTAAIQEQQALIVQLQADVAALKGAQA